MFCLVSLFLVLWFLFLVCIGGCLVLVKKDELTDLVRSMRREQELMYMLVKRHENELCILGQDYEQRHTLNNLEVKKNERKESPCYVQ